MAINYVLLGRKIQRLRSERRISQMEFAEMIATSATFVSRLERGLKGPSLETLIIRTPGGVYLPNVNSFYGSLPSGKPLQVYVPAALRPSYEDSETNGNWAALLSAGSVVFRELENSAYENLNWWRN